MLWLLPKVSADQRPLLRGVTMVQLSLGVIAVLLAAFSGLIEPRRSKFRALRINRICSSLQTCEHP